MDNASGGLLMALQESRWSWWTSTLHGQALLGLRWLLLLVGHGHRRQSAEWRHGFMQWWLRRSGGWSDSGGDVLPSFFDVRPVRVVVLCWLCVGVVFLCIECSLSVRASCCCCGCIESVTNSLLNTKRVLHNLENKYHVKPNIFHPGSTSSRTDEQATACFCVLYWKAYIYYQ
jgi:hypothetical protein